MDFARSSCRRRHHDARQRHHLVRLHQHTSIAETPLHHATETRLVSAVVATLHHLPIQITANASPMVSTSQLSPKGRLQEGNGDEDTVTHRRPPRLGFSLGKEMGDGGGSKSDESLHEEKTGTIERRRHRG